MFKFHGNCVGPKWRWTSREQIGWGQESKITKQCKWTMCMTKSSNPYRGDHEWMTGCTPFIVYPHQEQNWCNQVQYKRNRMINEFINGPRYDAASWQRHETWREQTERSNEERYGHAQEEKLNVGATITPKVPCDKKHAKSADDLKWTKLSFITPCTNNKKSSPIALILKVLEGSSGIQCSKSEHWCWLLLLLCEWLWLRDSSWLSKQKKKEEKHFSKFMHFVCWKTLAVSWAVLADEEKLYSTFVGVVHHFQYSIVKKQNSINSTEHVTHFVDSLFITFVLKTCKDFWMINFQLKNSSWIETLLSQQLAENENNNQSVLNANAMMSFPPELSVAKAFSQALSTSLSSLW